MVRKRASERRQSRRRSSTKKSSDGLHQFIIQKPYCSPARDMVMTALNPYGIQFHNFNERTVEVDLLSLLGLWGIQSKEIRDGIEQRHYPLATEATFTVSKAQANWAEYLMERSQRMKIIHGGVDKRNRKWASKHDGKMPKPWVEKNCTEGQNAWASALKIKNNNRG